MNDNNGRIPSQHIHLLWQVHSAHSKYFYKHDHTYYTCNHDNQQLRVLYRYESKSAFKKQAIRFVGLKPVYWSHGLFAFVYL